MTQEEKSILLKDLCGRLPYGVMMKGVNDDFVLGINTPPTRLLYVLSSLDFKPYLRPMSSMSRDEWYEFERLEEEIDNHLESITAKSDWLNKKGFDYRGLIPMGLALEAPEDMYK